MARRNGTQNEDFVRAAWDMAGDVCLSGNVMVGITVIPAPRRGVWEFHFKALRAVPNKKPVVAHKFVSSFPNASTEDLGAFLFRGINQLDRMVAEELGFKADDSAPRPSA